jgi:hypothetical protein
MLVSRTPPVRDSVALLGLAVVVAACGSGASRSSDVGPARPALSVRTDGAADALATVLLTAARHAPPNALWPALPAPSAEMAARWRFVALSHLQATGLAAGGGAALAGSATVRRLAAQPGAPEDLDGDGSNLDETLAAELARLADAAGWPSFEGAAPMLFPYREGNAAPALDLQGASRDDFARWRAAGAAGREVDLEHAGHALLSRAVAASGLLLARREGRIGATPRDGMLAVALLQQALAIEETLQRSLYFDGARLGPRDGDPARDPASQVRWLPRRVRVLEDARLAGAPEGYVAVDPASDLAALAVVIRGAVQIAWMAAPDNPHPELVEAFRGFPFGRAPGSAPLGPTSPGADGGGAVTWTTHVRALLQANCVVCHGPPIPISNFDASTYESVFRPGLTGGPPIVAGDHTRSPLWLILVGPWQAPTRTLQQMPYGGPYLSDGDARLIADWIDQGARRDPPPRPEPASFGSALARAAFAELRALHATAGAGPGGQRALQHRFVRTAADGIVLDEPSGFVEARSTGLATIALAQFAAMFDDEPDARPLLREVAESSLELLADERGAVFADYDLQERRRSARRADVEAHAALTSGLLAAARVLGDDGELLARARLVGATLLEEFALQDGSFVARPHGSGAAHAARAAAAVLEALQDLAADGAVGGAAAAHDAFLAVALPRLVLAEWDDLGERADDGVPDTDGNGIAEPAAAQRLPTFALAADFGDGPPPPRDEVTWSEHVLPLFNNKCTGCHVEGARRGEYRVDTPQLAARAGESGFGHAIVPGEPAASWLWQKLALRTPRVGLQMPQLQPPLDARGVGLVERWIRDGARQR